MSKPQSHLHLFVQAAQLAQKNKNYNELRTCCEILATLATANTELIDPTIKYIRQLLEHDRIEHIRFAYTSLSTLAKIGDGEHPNAVSAYMELIRTLQPKAEFQALVTLCMDVKSGTNLHTCVSSRLRELKAVVQPKSYRLPKVLNNPNAIKMIPRRRPPVTAHSVPESIIHAHFAVAKETFLSHHQQIDEQRQPSRPSITLCTTVTPHRCRGRTSPRAAPKT